MEKVGEGAFGEVYRAWDTRLDRAVALKLLRRQDSLHARVASAVIEEGRMLAQVHHPNVVTVHGADRTAFKENGMLPGEGQRRLRTRPGT